MNLVSHPHRHSKDLHSPFSQTSLPFVVDGPIRVSFTTFGKLVFVIKGTTQDKINGIKPLAKMDLNSLRLL